MQPLTSASVVTLFDQCRAPMGFKPEETLLVVHENGGQYFDAPSLTAHQNLLGTLLAQLPPGFYQGPGGPLLKAHYNRMGSQWGTYEDAQKLLIMGIAAGAVSVGYVESPFKTLDGSTSHSTAAHYQVREYVFTDTEGTLRNSNGTEV